GPDIYETVRIPGFFFKTWAYRLPSLEENDPQSHQLAPMLVGNQLRWMQVPARSPLAGAVAGVVFLIGLLGALLVLWLYRRSDRKFHSKVLARQFEPEGNQSLNQLNLDARDGPDFSNLP